jgi:hypothetical protein
MDKQEIFNKVWNHFIVEKHPRATSGGGCFYRTVDGRKCALGIFIPDEYYEFNLEGNGANSHRMEPVLIKLGLHEHRDLLGILQNVHDSSTSSDFDLFKKDLQIVASQYNLTIPSE